MKRCSNRYPLQRHAEEDRLHHRRGDAVVGEAEQRDRQQPQQVLQPVHAEAHGAQRHPRPQRAPRARRVPRDVRVDRVAVRVRRAHEPLPHVPLDAADDVEVLRQHHAVPEPRAQRSLFAPCRMSYTSMEACARVHTCAIPSFRGVPPESARQKRRSCARVRRDDVRREEERQHPVRARRRLARGLGRQRGVREPPPLRGDAPLARGAVQRAAPLGQDCAARARVMISIASLTAPGRSFREICAFRERM